MSKDPIRLRGNNPNFYAYTSDSLVRKHPFGLSDCNVHKDFKTGASYLVTGDAYEKFIKNAKKIGRPDGQFVAPSNHIDNLLTDSAGDISKIEKALGIPNGGWQNKGGVHRIDIPNPQKYNLRAPNSDMSGANELFVPRGVTSGGIPEAVINQVPIDQVNISKIL
ncbi:hypothetical protein ULVI_09075 [Cochleicola gelatinilyticus]|uniref:Uncharacterized protein n=1 Tax=Cochleicola gelatinilyticus TaxID=1763537 RepID=A0A167HL02_9FLAO|nr:hypothetical protein ULVI_09075 [Cochleicola gelatinilyticus]